MDFCPVINAFGKYQWQYYSKYVEQFILLWYYLLISTLISVNVYFSLNAFIDFLRGEMEKWKEN